VSVTVPSVVHCDAIALLQTHMQLQKVESRFPCPNAHDTVAGITIAMLS